MLKGVAIGLPAMDPFLRVIFECRFATGTTDPERFPFVADRDGAEPLRNWSQQAQRLSALDELKIDDHKPYLRALLYPARLLYSWETGAIGSNDEAVKFLQNCASELDLDLITRALHCRNKGLDPQPLFSERAKLLRLCDICIQVVAVRE